MLQKVLLLLLLSILALYAEPSTAQIKQAVQANPALLNTPQAKAAMAEKGVTKEQVTQKINESKSVDSSTSVVESEVKNSIETSENSSEQEKNSDVDEVVTKKAGLIRETNPFRFLNNEEISRNLKSKKQFLQTKKLSRYAQNFFKNRNSLNISSLPTPEYYVVTPGDTISIQMYGDRNEQYQLKIDSEGRVKIPLIGPISVAGLEFKTLKVKLEKTLKQYFKLSSFIITISKYSTIQVTLTGEVKAPGLYNISSFSTVKDLLINAHGILPEGSVRDIVVKRNSKIFAHIDFYELFFRGKGDKEILQHGDIVMVQKAKKLVKIDGLVYKSSIFELKKSENLKDLLRFSGGMRPNASKDDIKISRFVNNTYTDTLHIKQSDIKRTKLINGDSVYIYPLNYASSGMVSIYGNIVRPGSYNVKKASTLNELLAKELAVNKNQFFLPQTYFEYALIKRFNNNLDYDVISFSLNDILENKKTVKLKAMDEIYIFNNNEITSNAYITTKGTTLLHPGKLQYFENMTLNDAIYASGMNGVLDDKVRITTYNTEDYMPKTEFYSLKDDANKTLSEFDEIEVFDYYSKNILNPVKIYGEVLNPKTIYYEDNMSVADLIQVAGGLTKKAYTKVFTITRYYVDEDEVRHQKVLTFNSDENSYESVKLKPYDEVKISKILRWDSQDYETVSIKGEVIKPTTIKYGDGLNVNDLIISAGGLTKKAYTKVFTITRYYVDEEEVRHQKVLTFNSNENSYESVKLKPYDEVKISKILRWDSQDYETVSIKGEVIKPTTIKYGDGLSVNDLIISAGGLTVKAYMKKIEVVRYIINKNDEREREITVYDLEKDSLEQIKLKPYDEVTIFRIPKWYDKKSVTLSGQVKFPGRYTISAGEKLASVIKRAGGFTKEAYLYASLFSRESLKAQQKAELQRSAQRLRQKALYFSNSPEQMGELKNQKQQMLDFTDNLSKEAEKMTPLGRINLRLVDDLDALENSESNIVLHNGDQLIVPTRSDTVFVAGEVLNSTVMIYSQDMDVEDYIDAAGGLTDISDEDSIYVVHANGQAERYSSGIFSSSVELKAGDTIIVPIKLDFISGWQMVKDASQILYQLGIGVAAWAAITK